MIRTVFARRALPAASFCVAVSAALIFPSPSVHAQSPYHQSYRARTDLALYVEMDPDSQIAGRVRAGTGGIRLHWCEPEIPAAQWSDADPDTRLRLFEGRWCEVESREIVGNVPSDLLAPE